MTAALQQSPTSALLLRRPELLSHERAIQHLVGRMFVRTPLGAAEHLKATTNYGERVTSEGKLDWEARVDLAYDLAELHRTLFPQEYARSSAPLYSTLREQEFYRLVNQHLFPLPVEGLYRKPAGFLPVIPIKGTQPHDWIDGCCPFEELQLVFRLTLSLARMLPNPDGWETLGLAKEPANPLTRYPWSWFVRQCRFELTPLRDWPLAFYLVSYKTGNVWLDTLPGTAAMVEWSGKSIATLLMQKWDAEQKNLRVLGLDCWLKESHANVEAAVELWNRASEKTREDL